MLCYKIQDINLKELGLKYIIDNLTYDTNKIRLTYPKECTPFL